MRTIFQGAKRVPEVGSTIKRSTNPKVGEVIVKGPWRGMPIYTLSLEERATCPTDCELLDVCFGNNMRFAPRFAHGDDLQTVLREELALLSQRHTKDNLFGLDGLGGFAIRLHVLGDFYSREYVDTWERALQYHPEVHVFGYTHRTDEIWDAIERLNGLYPERWVVRQSALGGSAPLRAIVKGDGDGVVCPEETGRVSSCASCALCWNTNVPTILFRLRE